MRLAPGPARVRCSLWCWLAAGCRPGFSHCMLRSLDMLTFSGSITDGVASEPTVLDWGLDLVTGRYHELVRKRLPYSPRTDCCLSFVFPTGRDAVARVAREQEDVRSLGGLDSVDVAIEPAANRVLGGELPWWVGNRRFVSTLRLLRYRCTVGARFRKQARYFNYDY